MPYRWTDHTLTLWPHRSLPRQGFVAFIAATAALLAVPLLAQLGTAAWWVLLPFLTAPIAALWLALTRSNRDRDILETLTLTPDRITLTHRKGQEPVLTWTGNPYWTRATIHPTGGPVRQYLTLKAEGREAELGAFLTELERLRLKLDLDAALQAMH